MTDYGPCPVCGSTDASRERNTPDANLRDAAAVVTGWVTSQHPRGEEITTALLAGEIMGKVVVASSGTVEVFVINHSGHAAQLAVIDTGGEMHLQAASGE